MIQLLKDGEKYIYDGIYYKLYFANKNIKLFITNDEDILLICNEDLIIIKIIYASMFNGCPCLYIEK